MTVLSQPTINVLRVVLETAAPGGNALTLGGFLTGIELVLDPFEKGRLVSAGFAAVPQSKCLPTQFCQELGSRHRRRRRMVLTAQSVFA